MDDPKDEFVGMITELNKNKGLDSLSSQIIAELFISQKKLTMEDLAEKTGYSLSSICNRMNSLQRSGVIVKSKKPGSKQVYFDMENDIFENFLHVFRDKHLQMIKTVEEKVPRIIEEYKKNNGDEDERKTIEKYYRQILKLDEIMHDFVERIKRAKDDIGNNKV